MVDVMLRLVDKATLGRLLEMPLSRLVSGFETGAFRDLRPNQTRVTIAASMSTWRAILSSGSTRPMAWIWALHSLIKAFLLNPSALPCYCSQNGRSAPNGDAGMDGSFSMSSRF